MSEGYSLVRDSWTFESVETLKELWKEGRSSGEIASQLGKTRSAVSAKIHRLDLPKKRDTTKPDKPTVPDEPDISALIGTMDLDNPCTPHMCRWIYGDPKGEHGYCGKPTDGGPWCEEHLKRIWRAR